MALWMTKSEQMVGSVHFCLIFNAPLSEQDKWPTSVRLTTYTGTVSHLSVSISRQLLLTEQEHGCFQEMQRLA